MAKSKAPGVLFDSCTLGQQQAGFFRVDGGSACLISAAGLAGREVPLLKWVGSTDGLTGSWVQAVDQAGNPLILTDANVEQIVAMPGMYSLAVSGVNLNEEPCVTISKETLSKCELETLICADPPEAPPEPPVITIDVKPPSFTLLAGMAEDDTGECLPVYLRTTCDLTTGEFVQDCVYFDPETKEIIVAGSTIPVGVSTPKCETYNVRPFIVTGPIAAQPIATYIADALAADATPPAYATFGAPLATDMIASFNLVQEDGADIALVDGQETGGYTFTAASAEDMLNQAIEIEIPDGCEFTVNVCLKKCLDKAEVAALEK